MTTNQIKSIENSYWYWTEKYETELQELYSQMPSYGMTNNANMNLFIMASNIYYDMYNNGGCNLMDLDEIQMYILPFVKDIQSIQFNVELDNLIGNLKTGDKLEDFMDEVILYLQDKNLEYDKKVIFFNNSKRELSKTFVEGFNKIAFGTQESCDEWVKTRIVQRFKMVE